MPRQCAPSADHRSAPIPKIAVVPLITGHAADWIGLKTALIVPAICHAGILGFGLYARRPKQ